MRNLFIALAASLLITVGSAASIQQLQARSLEKHRAESEERREDGAAQVRMRPQGYIYSQGYYNNDDEEEEEDPESNIVTEYYDFDDDEEDEPPKAPSQTSPGFTISPGYKTKDSYQNSYGNWWNWNAFAQKEGEKPAKDDEREDAKKRPREGREPEHRQRSDDDDEQIDWDQFRPEGEEPEKEDRAERRPEEAKREERKPEAKGKFL